MRKIRFTEHQIIAVMKSVEAGYMVANRIEPVLVTPGASIYGHLNFARNNIYAHFLLGVALHVRNG